MSDYLLISEAAKAVEVETHVLRYWEEELELPIKRNELGHRYYTKEDVERFRRIKNLKERGFQLKAIKEILHRGSLEIVDREGLFWTGEDALKHDNESISEKAVLAEHALETMQEENRRDNMGEDIQSLEKSGMAIEILEIRDLRVGELIGEGTDGYQSRQKMGKLHNLGQGVDDRKRGEPCEEEQEWNDLKEIGAGERGQKEIGVGERGQKEIGAGERGQKEIGVGERGQNEIGVGERGQKEIGAGERRQIGIGTGPEWKCCDEEIGQVRENRMWTEEKAGKIRLLLQQIIQETVKESGEEFSRMIKDSVLKELDYQFRLQEERLEEREQRHAKRTEEYYRRMDELLREKSGRDIKKALPWGNAFLTRIMGRR